MTQDTPQAHYHQRFKNEFGIHFSESELQFALEFLDELDEEARREERERIVDWAKEQEWNPEDEANDPTKDFVAHDAYESKAEAWFYGYNQCLKDLIADLSDK